MTPSPNPLPKERAYNRLRIDGRVGTAALMFAIFTAMTLIALGFPAKARLMPLMVGVPACLLALAQLLIELRAAWRRTAPEPDAVAKASNEARAERRMILWVALFLAGVMAFGFLYAAPALVFAFLYWGERERLAVALAGGIGAWLILYGVFTRLLELFLFEGFLTKALIG